jgi:hypothetical protein
MSTDRDTTRIVRSWLEEGATALPDRVLDAVLDQLPTTPQRRSLWPARRFSDMNALARFAVAAAAVVAVALVGITLLPKQGGVAAPTRSASPIPSPISPASPSPRLLPSTGDLTAGTYSIPAGDSAPVALTLTVPAGWSTDEGFISKGPTKKVGESPLVYYRDRNVVTPWIVTHVYDGICQDRKLVSAGTTASQLARVLGAQKGRTVSAPTSVTLGGLPATRMEMTVPAALDVATCDGGIIRFWPDAGPDENGGLCCTAPGSTDVVYVVDAPGHPFVIVARHQASSTPAEIAELDAIVGSISIESPPSTASRSPAALLTAPEPGGDLPPGTYIIDRPFPARATITIPSGWTKYTVDDRVAAILVNHAKPFDGSGWGLFLLAGPHFYVDPCQPSKGTVGAGAVTTAAAVTKLLTGSTAWDTRTANASVGGRPATVVTVTAHRDTTSCRDAGATLWQTWDGTDYVIAPGQVAQLTVVDVDGVPIVILTSDFPESSKWENDHSGMAPNPTAHTADQIELRQILASVRIESASAASSPTVTSSPSAGPAASPSGS